jgi:tRNA-specific 2-thiouridylase
MYHTLGQRKGLGIGGTKEGSEDPWYVVDKDVENNILIVAQGHDHPRLMSVGLIAQQLHWVDREPVKGCALHGKNTLPSDRYSLHRYRAG